MEQVADELAQVSVVGLLLESERANVVLVCGKLSCQKRGEGIGNNFVPCPTVVR